MREAEPFGEPGYFFEGPRWRDGRWWTSDMHGNVVRSWTPEGEGRDELRIEDRPSGLSWMPDGSLLVVSMEKRLLLRLAPGAVAPEIHADLNPITADVPGFINDMRVDGEGRAYIGFDPDIKLCGFPSDKGRLLCVEPDGSARIVARDLQFPNAIMFSGNRLILADTAAACLYAYDIGPGGDLGPRSDWANLSGKRTDKIKYLFDGCDIDSASHVWAADCSAGAWRIAPGGEVVDGVALPPDYTAYACGLGGEDGRTLLICAANRDHHEERVKAPKAKLFTARVDVPA
ncbi:SMP-30/gluconolactonase/LRE family protein [Sphingomonas crocodyli]|uniref:Gluconolactonase n=1 Tax=Sphingomonas crocodyli TaxID=1979270 RepID=A0A437LWJ6_9SPHN|nr:SMP-30/gluconolactonase/LRE family protein [Sphingomonas crocodyli]RVT89743.1 gluconolactonase [Sphingomonas crocodyli]